MAYSKSPMKKSSCIKMYDKKGKQSGLMMEGSAAYMESAANYGSPNKMNGPGDDLLESIKKDHPNKTVKRVKGKSNEFRLFDESGSSVSLTRYPSKKKDNRITVKEAVQMKLNKNKK